jgi:hypothetical protein
LELNRTKCTEIFGKNAVLVSSKETNGYFSAILAKKLPQNAKRRLKLKLYRCTFLLGFIAI